MVQPANKRLVTEAAAATAYATAAQGAKADGAVQSNPFRFPVRSVIDVALCTANVDINKDRTVFMPFRAESDMVVTGMRMVSNTATTGATSVRFALYHYGYFPTAPAQRLTATMLARTANDTTTFSAADTVYTRSWSTVGGYPSEVRLVSGQWYAVAYQVLGGTVGKVVGPLAYRYLIAAGPAAQSSTTASALNPPPETMYASVSGDSMPSTYLNGFWAALTLNPDSTLAAPKRIATAGDSFIASYPGWLGAAVGQSGSRVFVPETYGVGGSTVDQALTQIDGHVTPNRPDYVIVHSGTNDIGNEGATANTIQNRYTALFNALLAIPTVSKVVVCTPPPSTYITGSKLTTLSDVRAWLLGLNRSGVVVADTGMAMSTGDGITSDATKRVDGVHPNALGQQAMGDVLAPVLAAL